MFAPLSQCGVCSRHNVLTDTVVSLCHDTGISLKFTVSNVCQFTHSTPSLNQLICNFSLQVKYNIIQFVYPELQNMYQWLEVDFHPLKLASRVQTSLDFIAKKDDLAPYIPALQDMTIMRVIKQVKLYSAPTLYVVSQCFSLSQLWYIM